MPNVRPSRALIVPLLLVLALVAASTIYLVYFRTPERERYFTDSRFRALAVLGEQIEGALQGRADAVFAATWRGQGWEEAVREVPDLEPVTERERCKPGPGALATRGGIYVELNSEPALGGVNVRSTAPTEWGVPSEGDVFVQRTGAVLYFRSDCRAPTPTPTRPPAEDKPLEAEIYLLYGRTPSATPTPSATRTRTDRTPNANTPPTMTATPTAAACAEAGPRRVAVCAKSRLAQIVEPFIAGSEVNGFEVFVADAQGNVLLERGPVDLGLTRLPSAPESPTGADGGATPAADTKAGTADGLPTIGELTRGSTVRAVTFAGVSYKLLAQPLHVSRVISSDGSRAPTDAVWVVGMFVPMDTLKAEARTVSIGSLTTIPMLVLLILLAMPAVKIAFMGPREQLSAGTVRALMLFVVAAAGIAVVLAIENLSYGWLEDQLDSELQSLSKSVRGNFAAEVRRAYDTVDLFRTVRGEERIKKLEQGNAEPKTAATQCIGPPPGGWSTWLKNSCGLTKLLTQPTLRCPPYGDEAKQVDDLPSIFGAPEVCAPLMSPRFYVPPDAWGCQCEPFCMGIAACMRQLNPYFEMLILTDQCGWQREKWTAKEQITTLINMGEHRSFRDAKDKRLWGLPDGRQAVLHLQQSPNTAQFVATLALPVEEEKELLGVVIGVPELMSIRAPVLPPGFGMAVVQGDGRVVFHSQEPVRNLYENFLTENTARRRIEAAAATRHATFLESDYRGRTHRMFVHPLESSPWTLIAYRDKELPRTLDLDITGAWLLLFVLYVLGLAALWVLVRLFAGADDGEWIWPDATRWRAYWVAVGILFFVALANAVEIAWGPEEGLARPLVGAGGPLAALALVFLLLAQAPQWVPTRDGGSHTRCRWRVAAWMVLAISVVGMTLAFLLSCDLAGLFNLLIVLAGAAVVARVPTIDRTLGKVPTPDAGRVRRRFPFPIIDQAIAKMLGKAPQKSWKSAYVSAGLALLLVVGVLPSIAIYKDAFDFGLGAFLRQGQRDLGLALAKREDDIRRRYGDKDLWPDDVLRERIQTEWDLPRGAFFWDGNGSTGHACPDPPGSSWPAWTRSSVAGGLACLTGRVCENKQWEDSCRLAARHISGLAMAQLPVYHRESGQLREFLFDEASDGRWCAERTTDQNGNAQIGMTLNDPRLENTALTSGSVWVQRAESLPPWPFMPPPIPIALTLILIGLALAGGYQLIRWYARRLFDLDHHIDTNGGGGESCVTARGLLLLHPTASVRDELHKLVSAECWIDLQERPRPWSAADGRTIVVVDHLEHRLDDGDLNRHKLALLERLVLKQESHVVVLSKLDPLQYFCDRLRSPGDEKADEPYVTSEEIDRWAAVMERLVKVAAPLSGVPTGAKQSIVDWIGRALRDGREFEEHTMEEWENEVDTRLSTSTERKSGEPGLDAFEKWKRALKEECRWTPCLRGIAVEAAALFDPPEDPLDRVADLARAHYRTLWSTLTDQQRLVLIHLARNGFANPNPRNWPIVRDLAKQGFIRRTPALRLMNETFRRFVAQVETEEQVSQWERAAGPSTWSRIRSVVMVASVVIAVFLFQTQRQLLTVIAGGLAAAAGLAATVSNLLGFFQGRRVPSPPPQESTPS